MSPQMDLLPFVNKAGCECLNESDEHGFENCLRKDSSYLESDCDEQVVRGVGGVTGVTGSGHWAHWAHWELSLGAVTGSTGLTGFLPSCSSPSLSPNPSNFTP